jgi:phage shock protein PspC (stress-responsive transcriptional regulator)
MSDGSPDQPSVMFPPSPVSAPEPPPLTSPGTPFTAEPPPFTSPAPPLAAEPPPLTAFAWRTGLVRPTRGRLLAGVCGALGRATNTDPVLWRVVLAVLTIFGGIGVLAYLLGWVLLPAEGDSASPLEALLGRGHSGTSATLTVIAALIIVASIGAFVAEPLRPGLFGVLLLGGALLVLLRDQRGRGRASTASSLPGYPDQASSPPPYGQAAMPAPHTPPYAPGYGPPPLGPPPLGPPPPGAPAWRPPPPPRPRPPRSRLGLLTFSVVLIALGTLAIADLSGLDVPGPAYPALTLAIIGLGLVFGAWLGRARILIALGILVTFALGGSAFADQHMDGWPSGGTVAWAPQSVVQMQHNYRHSLGDATLDLSGVSFTGQDTTVDVSVDMGNLEIIVPDTVDVVVTARVDIGNATIFNDSLGGIGSRPRTITDLGRDGPGGGQLTINATVDLGNLEVHR